MPVSTGCPEIWGDNDRQNEPCFCQRDGRRTGERPELQTWKTAGRIQRNTAEEKYKHANDGSWGQDSVLSLGWPSYTKPSLSPVLETGQGPGGVHAPVTTGASGTRLYQRDKDKGAEKMSQLRSDHTQAQDTLGID